jgi:glycosyltransferase involved in cell wall biosynthesis
MLRWGAKAFSRRKSIGLSIVVVAYNMPRELPRTLLSLSANYQRHVHEDDYEVIVVDNGSRPPVDRAALDGLRGNFRLIRIDPASPSPAHAVNRGIAEAKGDVIGVMVDGARIATPGLVHFAGHGARLYRLAVVASLNWYLGYDYQRWAMRSGYDQAREDRLLASIDWPKDGYRLFDIGTIDESCVEGWFHPIAESNALFMNRAAWEELGGMDERFDIPGGGLVNLDLFRRALELREAQLVLLLGEATFHQIHGGVATNLRVENLADGWVRWDDHFESIRGHRYHWWPKHQHPPVYLGTLPRAVLSRMVHAALSPVRFYGDLPLGRDFDAKRWSLTPLAPPADPIIAMLVAMMHEEFQSGRHGTAVALARLIRAHAPGEREALNLLSLIPGAADQRPPDAAHFLTLARAHRYLGEDELARDNYREALRLDPDLAAARAGLAETRMPKEAGRQSS